MRNVFVQWAVGALILLTAVVPLRAEGEDPTSSLPPPPPHTDKNSSPLPPIPKDAPPTAGTLRLPSGPKTRLEGLVDNIKALRLDPGPTQRIAQALERAPRMTARQFSELVTLTGRLFDDRLTPDQQAELKRLFDEESFESKDLTGISFASALRVASVERRSTPEGERTPVAVAGDASGNKNPFAGGLIPSRSAPSAGSLDQLIEQATKKQSAQLEQLIKAQLDQTKLAIAALGASKGEGTEKAGAPNATKGLLDGLLADLRKGGKGEDGGRGRDRRGEDDEPRGRNKREDDHADDKRGRSDDREGALSRLRERERERERERDRDRGRRNANKGGGGESKDSSSGGEKKDENKKEGRSSSSGSSSRKETPSTESKMQKSDFKSLLDEQKKKLEPEAPGVPPMPPAKKGLGPSTPIDQALPPPSSGGAGASPQDDGSQGQQSGLYGKNGNTAMNGGNGGGSLGGDPFGSIGYGDDGGGGSGERFSFTRLVEYGGAGGGGGMGGEIATSVDGGGLVDELLAANDKNPAARSARESGQVLRVGIDTSPKAKRWIFDWTREWPAQICKGPDAKEVGVCEKVMAAKGGLELRRRIMGAKEAATTM